MNSDSRKFPLLLCSMICLLWTACGGYEEKRVRELMHEKGFGTRAEGDATIENYVSGGDAVQFLLPPQTYQDPAAAQLYMLSLPQRVSIDGKILVPYVGPVLVLGKTEAQLGALVKGLLRPVFPFEINLQARIMLDSKNIYAFGETARKGVIPLLPLGGDLTFLRAVSTIGWTSLANLGRVYLIRPDAEHPLVMEINLHEMIITGRTARNFRIRENDIIYIPPTFLGLIARILERALAPVALAVQAMFGVASIRSAYQVATGQRDNIYFRF